jgi:predicted secreted protein with PEFG-CTERM motif
VDAESMSVSTNNEVYYMGDYIVAFGNVGTVFEDMPVTLQIYSGTTLIDVGQVPTATDGTFAASFHAEGKQWKGEGIYSVRAFYTPTILAETTFEFYNQVVDKSSAVFPVNIPNSGTFDVGYTIRGGEVKDVEIDMERYSILIQTSMDSNGNLILKLPRESFDAQSEGVDETFIILISKENTSSENFMQVEYEEVATGSDYRTIRIPLEEGDKWVEVIGTYVIPEFGSIAIIILVVAISSAVIISKNRLSVRYN